MTTHNLNGKNVLLVKVPEGSSGFVVWMPYTLGVGGKKMNGGIGFNHPDPAITFVEIEFPEGSYSILGKGLASDVTEEEARGLVERVCRENGFRYDNYENQDEHTMYDTATASLHSLLTLHGYAKETTVILIQN